MAAATRSPPFASRTPSASTSRPGSVGRSAGCAVFVSDCQTSQCSGVAFGSGTRSRPGTATSLSGSSMRCTRGRLLTMPFGSNQQATPWSAVTRRTTSSIGVDQRSSRFHVAVTSGGDRRRQTIVGHAGEFLADLPQARGDGLVASVLCGEGAGRIAARGRWAVGPEEEAAEHVRHGRGVEGGQRALRGGLGEDAVRGGGRRSPRQLEREQQVGELRLPVSEPALVVALALEVLE